MIRCKVAEMKIEKILERMESVIEELAELWEASVRATHNFLPEEAVVGLRPMVRQGLEHIETLAVLKNDKGDMLAFFGAEDQKIEMLFVAPDAQGKGLGKALIGYAINVIKCNQVDVNEQNPRALEFYKKMGFRVASRSELDGQGKPYPILHMRLAV